MGTLFIIIGLGLIALIVVPVVGLVGWLVIEAFKDMAKSPFFQFIFSVAGVVVLGVGFIIFGLVEMASHQ